MASGDGTTDKKRAFGSPTKDFFVRMITRDITLSDCIMDLVDNSIDGARRTARIKGSTGGNSEASLDLAGFGVKLTVSKKELIIADSCGGISLDDAVNYAFHFGRRKDAPESDHSIGLYGIGMKRAIFKVGRLARLESRHSDDAFSVTVDVDEWEKDESDWDFDIESIGPSPDLGTRIVISKLYDPIAAAFGDKAFVNSLVRAMARDYAFVLAQGFSIKINDISVPRYAYNFKESDQVASAAIEYIDNEVRVRIVAGMMRELDNEIPSELRPDQTDLYGWYVVCNDRVVLAGDKSDLTVWGNGAFQEFHPQYNGFAGFLFLSSDDSRALPWTTTKREVDTGDPLYMRAVSRMKEMTSQFIEYTNKRKADPESARAIEKSAHTINVSKIAPAGRERMKLPEVVAGKEAGTDHVTITYRKPKAQVKEIGAAFGNQRMSAREVGAKCFDYFRKMELGK